MILEDQQLAVCQALPELVEVAYHCEETFFFWRESYRCGTSTIRRIHWPTEGLQVMHEAEKLVLKDLTLRDSYIKSVAFDSTWQQRLEAWCRVRHPEKFGEYE